MRGSSRNSARRSVIVTAMLLVVAWATPGRAHNVRAELAFWGNFGPANARCQRLISRATARCVQDVLRAREACLGAQLAGEACDTDATDAAVDAARQRARAVVAQECTPAELMILRFNSLDDVANDMNAGCRNLDTATASAMYGPAMVGGTVGAVDPGMQVCINAAAAAGAKLLRFAIHARQQALDSIATRDWLPSQKQGLMTRAVNRIARARGIVKRQLTATCPDATFLGVYGRSTDAFLTQMSQRADCFSATAYVQNAVLCPTATCGNGMQEAGEQCDDGNDFDGDGCKANCTAVSCDGFPTTYDLIQRSIFENRGCAVDTCHGSGFATAGGLDLRAGASYASLIDVPAQTVPGFKRVDPGNKDNSLLWINLAARTLPNEYHAPLRGMPIGGEALTPDEVEGLRLWIVNGGASRTGTVEGAGPLLLTSACLPEPKPLQITPLEPPPVGEGVQMHMPAWTLAPKREAEVCFASYYDFTGQIPAAALSADGTRFRYKSLDIRQNPSSHHLIVNLYHGAERADDPVWGAYTCKGGPTAGAVCNPYDLGFCGTDGECATDPDPTAIACIGFGPQTGFDTLLNGGFAFSQQTATEFHFPTGVYDEMPIKGVVLWNSHAFNLTQQPGTMEAWVNVTFPSLQEQQHQQQLIFNANKIFWTTAFPPFPLPALPAFQEEEICNVHRLGRDSALGRNQTMYLYELSGHTHEHGKRFRIFRGSFTCKGGTQLGQACSPFNPEMCPGGTCTDDGGRDPQQALLYTSLVYNDPVKLRFDPPIAIKGNVAAADRSLTYCAHYDNGAAPNFDFVKRRSTSPPAGTLYGLPIGGPCATGKTRCIGGPHHNELCNGNKAFCDSSSGAGDGDCDACPLTGGFRTQDEMFILFGSYWLQ